MALLPVKYFNNLQAGAPQLTNNWGELTALLDACLVDGFNAKTATDVQSIAQVATATFGTAHGFKIGQVIVVTGAAQTEYNGEFRVLSATTLTLTFAIVGTPFSPASGTIVFKAAPLNWQRLFSTGSKRAFRSTNILSNKPVLRVDDGLDPVYNTTYAKFAKVTMSESMSDIDTHTGAQAPFLATDPLRNHVGTGVSPTSYSGWAKWYYSRYGYTATVISESNGGISGNKQWQLVGDDRGFYLLIEGQAPYGKTCYCFTDFESFRQGDGYNTLMAYTDAYVQGNQNWGTSAYIADYWNYFNRSNDFTGKILLKDHTQVGSPVSAGFTTLNMSNAQNVSGYLGGFTYPNGADYSLILHPFFVRQGNTATLRGKMPGAMWVHNDNPMLDLDQVSGVVNYAGRTFVLLSLAYTSVPSQSKIAFDITGPWW